VQTLFDTGKKLVQVLSFLFVALMGVIAIVGSGGGEDITGGGVTVSSIDISPSVVPKDLLQGLDQQFVAVATYSDGSRQILTTGVTWNSSFPSVVAINSVGLATASSVGTSQITASMSGVTSNAVALTVANPGLLSIQVSPPSVPNGLPVGAAQQFVALGVYNNNQVYDITDRVIWSSDNTSVVTINSGGLATGQGSLTASANISASYGSPAVTSNSVNIAVSQQSAIGLIVEPQEAVPLPVNRTQQFRALLLYNNDTTFDVTDEVEWMSNTPAVASVSNTAGTKGLVTGLATGRVTITAIHPLGPSDTGVLDVTSASIQEVKLYPTVASAIPVEHTQGFTAEGRFSDGVTRVLSSPNWFIDNSSVATFRSRGSTAQVLGVAAGTANLVYLDTLANGILSGLSNTVPLTVTGAVLNGMTVNPPTATVPDDSQTLFAANGSFSDGSNREITQDVWWSTGDNTVAGFSAEPGALTALSRTNNMSASVQANRVNSLGTLVTATATVNVQATTLTGLTINAPASPVSVWDLPAQFTVTANFSNGATADYTERVTWSVDVTNPIIANVSTASGTKGQVTGVRAGSATLRVVDPQTNTTSLPLSITISGP